MSQFELQSFDIHVKLFMLEVQSFTLNFFKLFESPMTTDQHRHDEQPTPYLTLLFSNGNISNTPVSSLLVDEVIIRVLAVEPPQHVL